MPKQATPTWTFVLVVVRKGHRFLAVQETKHDQLWYLPAGRVEPGEDFIQAAIRETREEAGIPIVVEGVVRLEYTPSPQGTARCRAVVIARPKDDTPPKTTADEHTLRAEWLTIDELVDLPCRGSAFIDLFRYIEHGGAVAPLSILADERDPY